MDHDLEQSLNERLPEKNPLPIGTRLSGYIGGFTEPGFGSGCWNCMWFDNERCGHAVVKADPEVMKDEYGEPVVEPSGCCSFIRREQDNE